MKNSLTNQSGFTLVELIIVIVILAIISAAVIPNYFDLSDNAEKSKLQATANAFASSVNIAHASWLAAGGTSTITSVISESNDTIGVNSDGWPENTSATGGDGTITANECLALFNALIQNSPSITLSPSTTGEFTAAQNTATSCIYSLNGPSGNGHFIYNMLNGSVSVTYP